MSAAERIDLLRYAILHLRMAQMVLNVEEQILYSRKTELVKARLLMFVSQLHRNLG
jgi:hypothetical protein